LLEEIECDRPSNGINSCPNATTPERESVAIVLFKYVEITLIRAKN
jgi:hypothetical protein